MATKPFVSTCWQIYISEEKRHPVYAAYLEQRVVQNNMLGSEEAIKVRVGAVKQVLSTNR
jgi:hypothetical protein